MENRMNNKFNEYFDKIDKSGVIREAKKWEMLSAMAGAFAWFAKDFENDEPFRRIKKTDFDGIKDCFTGKGSELIPFIAEFLWCMSGGDKKSKEDILWRLYDWLNIIELEENGLDEAQAYPVFE